MGRIWFFCIALTWAVWPVSVSAQQVQRIAAIVNDDVISIYDLTSRMQLVIMSARLENSPQVRRRIARQVLRTLIDERLKLQEAKKRKLKVSKRDIRAALSEIESQNRLQKGQLEAFLVARGVPMKTLIDRVRADEAWRKVIRLRLGRRVSVSTEEVQEFIDRLKSRQGETQYRISEIQLPVGSSSDAAQIRGAAQRLVEQIRGGAPFAAVARQFSQSASSAVGGDLGWQHESELEDSLKPIVPNLANGQVTNPIRTNDGFRIIALTGKRKTAGGDPANAKVRLAQLFLPVSQPGSSKELEGKAELARSYKSQLSNCDDVSRIAKSVGSPRPASLGRFAISDLSPSIRKVVQTLDPGSPSDPIKSRDGVMVLMVCDREAVKSKLPNADQVRRLLINRRLQMLSRRHMRDIRLSSVVDVRV